MDILKYGGAGETKLMVKYSFSMNKYRRYKCIVKRSPKFIRRVRDLYRVTGIVAALRTWSV